MPLSPVLLAASLLLASLPGAGFAAPDLVASNLAASNLVASTLAARDLEDSNIRASNAGASNLEAPRLMAATLAALPALRTGDSRWGWPLAPTPEVVRAFDPPGQRWLAGHRGVDLAAPLGAPVLAPRAGRISFSGKLAGRGVVVVDHLDGLRSTFEPVAGSPSVGAAVAPGEEVGTLTAEPGHCVPRTCLHWGVRRGDTYLDPLLLVARPEVVLLPLW